MKHNMGIISIGYDIQEPEAKPPPEDSGYRICFFFFSGCNHPEPPRSSTLCPVESQPTGSRQKRDEGGKSLALALHLC